MLIDWDIKGNDAGLELCRSQFSEDSYIIYRDYNEIRLTRAEMFWLVKTFGEFLDEIPSELQ